MAVLPLDDGPEPALPVAWGRQDARDPGPSGAVLHQHDASGRPAYRYLLRRIWDPPALVCDFVLLNPATADATKDDPIIRRCVSYARRWGFGGLVVTNLYAWRATDPNELLRADRAVGPLNDHFLAAAARGAGLVVCGWGTPPRNFRPARARHVTYLLREHSHMAKLYCLATNKDGSPAHPLYQRADAGLREFPG